MTNRRSWLWEFSKRIVVGVAVLFFVVVLYCAVHAWAYPDSTATDRILESMTDVFKATVITYGVKAGVENAIKIHKNRRAEGYDEETDEP